jgi:hypothetical protein
MLLQILCTAIALVLPFVPLWAIAQPVHPSAPEWCKGTNRKGCDVLGSGSGG